MASRKPKKSRATGKAHAPSNPLRPASLPVRRALEDGNLAQVEKSLTSRQRRFCHEYVLDFNKTAAVMRAGYTTVWPKRQALNLFKNAGIVALIEELKTKQSFEVTAVDPNYVTQGIMKITGDPETKPSDKLTGYALLARILGMLVERQVVTTDAVQNEEAKQEAGELVSLLRQLHERAAQDKKDDALLAIENIAETNNVVLEFKKGA